MENRRKRDSGALEVEHAAAITRACTAAKQWLGAGLSDRALSELNAVQDYCSFSTEVGAAFHMQRASVLEACKQPAQARRVLQRVMSDASSSSQRWSAEQALERSLDSSGGKRAASDSPKSEFSGLFGSMPDSW